MSKLYPFMATQTRNKIRAIREVKGYSQDFMAEKMNISQKTYSRIESGNVKLDIDRLKQISDLLEVEPSALLDNETNVFNYYDKVNNSGTFYNVSSEEYINHLTAEIEYLKEQNDRLMRLLESKA
ncbi:helix-turn-helix transcriptional regulator [Flavobacterium supellecticarium]|uniref:Helix-turn-helix transcriptional regulator n=1 Tax=Flavobacterium supellecticarium TaxID=2565924 RepID=A0A4S4A350_9FLAO|nr:helix-turn-helix transcriptional regulator [Flavobacterium supellecticarium]THF52840.1 helix-turn-helix transcriptional regulator [Flavobacterium supellecticarium]